MSSPKVAILIPNYNGALFICETVRTYTVSLPEWPIFVIDDCSSDDSIIALESQPCNLIRRSHNGGFAAAVNSGLQHLLRRNYDCALVSNSDATLSVENAKLLRELISSYRHSDLPHLIGFSEEIMDKQYTSYGSNISGFLFLLRLDIISEIGLFDETFFMYGEETDYFRRVEDSSYTILQSSIPASHSSERSASGKLSNSWLAIRNSIYIEAKRRHPIKILIKIALLFLLITRLHRPRVTDPSLVRIRRPGLFLGLVFLVLAVIWNLHSVLSSPQNVQQS